jgi:N-acetylglucosamine kinase-like BadF-type ATPase
MIIIADSGGSKIDWRLIQNDGSIEQANAPGFNPYYQPIEDLKRNVQEILLPMIHEQVNKIFFYGAGVSSEKNQEAIKDAFLEYFPQAHIEIGWDLLAAARGHEPGIACIMGTGSNSCQYDGKNIVGNVANLGWILADEGSGANIGRKFLVDYLRQVMPEGLRKQFYERFPLTREEFLEKVYQQERPSAFLASFANVMKYDRYQHLKVHFTGSIAFYFSDILRQVAQDKGITVKNILEGPIAGLTLYHQNDSN